VIAVYPGTFDPPTHGHLDVLERASRMFEELVVGVSQAPGKNALFSYDERITMIKEVTNQLENVIVVPFGGLLVEFVKSRGAQVIVRGLRAISDFDYEFQMALMNRRLAPELDTVFLFTKDEYSYLSSRLVKEIAGLGGDVSKMVPPGVLSRLLDKLNSRR